MGKLTKEVSPQLKFKHNFAPKVSIINKFGRKVDAGRSNILNFLSFENIFKLDLVFSLSLGYLPTRLPLFQFFLLNNQGLFKRTI